MSVEIKVLRNPFNGHRLVRYITVIDPIPPGAIRVRTTDGLPPNKTPYTTYTSAVKVDGYDDVYDVWNEYNGKYNWSYILTQCNNLYEVLDSNPEGITSSPQLLFNQSTLQKISNFHPCPSAYGLFAECSALTAIPTFDTTDVKKVDSWFYNCSSVQSGALEMYNQLTAQGTVTTHGDTFHGCGSGNASGMADLLQIPNSWGGKAGPYLVTLQTDGHGKISASNTLPMHGETVTLANTASGGYVFTGYSITGSTLTGNQFNVGTANITAKAGYSASMDYVTIGTAKWLSDNLRIDDGGTGIYKQTVNYGQGPVEEYYYTYAAAIRVANSLDGWHLSTSGEWTYLLSYAGGSTAGKNLKSTYGWTAGNGLDTYGFAAFPAGYYNADFYGTGKYVDYWQSGTIDSKYAYVFELNKNDAVSKFNNPLSAGCLVRLVKDA